MSTNDEHDIGFQVESRLMSHGVYVTDFETTDGYELTYESASAAETGVIQHREVGKVINVFLELHDDDWRGRPIHATVTDLDGRNLGRWHVTEDWLRALQTGDLTETAFSQKVIDTIEPVAR
jgi:hypothetical protein